MADSHLSNEASPARPSHWTYANFASDSDLMQGDIIAPTEEFKAILRDVHAHFDNAKYRAFLVTTQSCDLVVRNSGRCKARHINIAAIRRLEDVYQDLLASECESVTKTVIYSDQKLKAKQFMQRVFNQNEQATGLFYLHDDEAVNIGEPCVALLRVSIALRAADHYDVLRASRCGRLASDYQNGLAWMIANLYGRIGTADWQERQGGKAQLEKLVRLFIEKGTIRWVDRRAANAAKAAITGFPMGSTDELVNVISEHAPPSALELAADAAVTEARRVFKGMCTEDATKLQNLLLQSPHLRAALSQAKLD